MKLMRVMRRGGQAVAEVVCPETCWVDPAGGPATGGLCTAVRTRIAVLAAQSYCCHCGLTVGPHEIHNAWEPCGRCGQRDAGVVRTARVGTFSEPLITLVHRLKFGRSWEVARLLAPFLYQAMLRVSEATGVPIDGVVPVPLHWTRRVRRGFNQAQELARELSLLSGWRVANVLRRVRRTAEQARIDAPTHRVDNVRGAFRGVMRANLAGRHVWLLDDVSTTGATLHAAATALRLLPRGARPASINAGVVCVADHGSPDPAA